MNKGIEIVDVVLWLQFGSRKLIWANILSCSCRHEIMKGSLFDNLLCKKLILPTFQLVGLVLARP